MEPTSSISLAPTPKDLVIQCSGCKTIVGDTANNACAATLGTAKIIALPAASDVSVDRIPQKDTLDNHQYTYFHVCCSGCGSVIGRMYTEAPAASVPLLNTFAFDVSKCSSYRLGSADIRVSGGDNPSGLATVGGLEGSAGVQGGAAGGGGDDSSLAAANVGELLSRIENLESEMLKMQGMILLHDGQLQTLPGYPVAADT